jgi:hypothetical protein
MGVAYWLPVGLQNQRCRGSIPFSRASWVRFLPPSEKRLDSLMNVCYTKYVPVLRKMTARKDEYMVDVVQWQNAGSWPLLSGVRFSSLTPSPPRGDMNPNDFRAGAAEKRCGVVQRLRRGADNAEKKDRYLSPLRGGYGVMTVTRLGIHYSYAPHESSLSSSSSAEW